MTYTFESMISELLENKQADIDAYFSSYQEPVEKSIKIIQNKIQTPDFLEVIKKYGRHLQQPDFTSNSDIFYIKRDDTTSGLGKHWLHTGGFFYIQELAASLPVQFLPIKQGDIVLDMCSAPGGKAIQISDKGGYVVSNEVSGSRIIPLQYNLNRTGTINSTVTSIQGGNRGKLVPDFFDHILVDAPCSGEGTGFKSDDGTKRWRENDIHKIAHLQKDLLSSAINACKVGGTIIYSTCTINPWENEGVVSAILEKFGDTITLEMIDISHKSIGITNRENKDLLTTEQATKVVRFWPHIQHTGGFFIAKLVKHGVEHSEQSRKSKDNTTKSQLDISSNLQEKVATILLEDYGIEVDATKYFFVSSQKKIYLTTPQYTNLHDTIRSEKTGVPIFKINTNGERNPLHGLGNCLGDQATKNYLTLPEDILQKYSEGHDVEVSNDWGIVNNKNKYAILRRDSYGFSVGKIVDGYIKNKFIK